MSDCLELEARFGLRFDLREEVTLAPCDDGVAIPFWSSPERAVEAIGERPGAAEAERYRRSAR